MKIACLSGGGSHGAFQVGVLKTLLTLGLDWYDGFVGISVGALNAAFLAQYKNAFDAIQDLEELWNGLDTSSIYKRHFPFGYLHGLWKPNLVDSSPLQALIHRHLDPKRIAASKKLLRVGAFSTQTYGMRWWGEQFGDLEKAVVASSAFPVMFAPTHIDGLQWIDGGVRTVTPLSKAIEIGATEVDVFLTTPEATKHGKKPAKNMIEVAERTLESLIEGVQYKDLKVASLYNLLIQAGVGTGKRKVKIRCFAPKSPLPSSSLDFSPSYIREMMVAGAEAASGDEQ